LNLNIFGSHVLLSLADQNLVEKAIETSELLTSGEIRVHVDKNCDIPILDRAAEVFDLLEMNKTELRNGVLIYLNKREKQFAIIGDLGINQVVPEGFWAETAENMAIYFKNGAFAKGIIEGVESAGKKLQHFFPRNANDTNELSNKVSFGKNK